MTVVTLRGLRAIGFAGGIAGALLAAAPAPAATDVVEAVSPGGIPFWLVEEPAIPMVAIEVSFAGGAALDPADRAGATAFLAAMLGEGAGDLDSLAFAERAQLLAAETNFDADRDSFSISARFLTENLAESAELLRLALVEPRFDEEPMRRVRGQILSSIRADETDPDAMAAKAWFAAAFPDHPYGRPTAGTAETVSAITVDDLRAARLRALNLSAAKIAVVGAVTAETAGALLDRMLGELPRGPVAAVAGTSVAKSGGVEVVPFDAPQSTVMFGHAGPLRGDPDFIPAFVMNHILGGGGFSSRLTTEVREKRGLAYSAYAYLAPFDHAGLIMGGVGTANERVAESIAVIREEWFRMADQGVTEAELEAAKRYLTGAYALRFDSNRKIAAALVGIQRDGEDATYVKRRNALVEAVTVDDIRRVAQRWLKPGDLAFVVVGRPEGLPLGQ